jgi:hypothetical protein
MRIGRTTTAGASASPRLGRQAEFEEYVELIRLEYKRKWNFIKLLDGIE